MNNQQGLVVDKDIPEQVKCRVLGIAEQKQELSNCSQFLLSQLEMLSERINAIVRSEPVTETKLGSYLYYKTEKIKNANKILQSLLLRFD